LRQRIAERRMQLPRLLDNLVPEDISARHDGKHDHHTQQNPAHSITRSEAANADGFAPPQQETDHPTQHFATDKRSQRASFPLTMSRSLAKPTEI
jgi:hypothetical protein